MKIKVILLLLALALVAPMIIPGPDGNPIMTLADWKPDTIKLEQVANNAKNMASSASQKIADSTKLSLGGDNTDSGNVMHKWQDAEGVWHFSDSVPEASQVKNLTTGEIPKLANDTLAAGQVRQEPAKKSEVAKLSPFTSPDKVTQLKSDAEDIKRMAQERADTLESM